MVFPGEMKLLIVLSIFPSENLIHYNHDNPYDFGHCVKGPAVQISHYSMSLLQMHVAIYY